MTSSDAKAFPLAPDGLPQIADLAIHRIVNGLARGLEVLGYGIADLRDGNTVAQRLTVLDRPFGTLVAQTPRFLHAAPREPLEPRYGTATTRALARDERNARAQRQTHSDRQKQIGRRVILPVAPENA